MGCKRPNVVQHHPELQKRPKTQPNRSKALEHRTELHCQPPDRSARRFSNSLRGLARSLTVGQPKLEVVEGVVGAVFKSIGEERWRSARLMSEGVVPPWEMPSQKVDLVTPAELVQWAARDMTVPSDSRNPLAIASAHKKHR